MGFGGVLRIFWWLSTICEWCSNYERRKREKENIHEKKTSFWVISLLWTFFPGSLQRHQIWKNPSGGGTHFHTNTMVLIPNKENHFDWSMSDTRRLLHALYQVGDLDRSIKYVSFDWFIPSKQWLQCNHDYVLCMHRFYTECLGMKLLRKRDIPEERYTNAFLGYGTEDSHFVVVLAHRRLFNFI